MLTKADITGITAKYGPNIAKHYYTIKKTPVRMLSNAFLTFADQDKIISSVAFIDISPDKSGCRGIIISKLGIHYGLENSKGFIEFSEVSSCEIEFTDGSGANQYKAVLRVKCGEKEHLLDGSFAKAPLKHIIDEAHALYVQQAEKADVREYERKPTSDIVRPSAEERRAHFAEIREKAQRETAEIAEFKRLKAEKDSTQYRMPPADKANGTAEHDIIPQPPKTALDANTEQYQTAHDELSKPALDASTEQSQAAHDEPSKPALDASTEQPQTAHDEPSEAALDASTEQPQAAHDEISKPALDASTEQSQAAHDEPSKPALDASTEQPQTAHDEPSEAAIDASTKQPQAEYVRKATSVISNSDRDARAAHFKEIREKAQRETAEIAEIKKGHAPLTTECRAPVKPKPNPAPFGYTETVIAQMTISKNDISDVYMQDVIATAPNPDIYARSSEIIGNCMKKDKTLTEEKITEYLRENLTWVTDVFLSVAKKYRSEIPPRTMHSIEVLDAAAKDMDKYIKQGEPSAKRVMLFMTYQMITYTDNIIQSEETKAVCLNFLKTFGTLGLILSMLDLELY